ncbi:DNRLRE domain-containing protein [Coraliomargarita algicola]|uniref:DNRLRE domain-containing protein n=1 Tax=Coraliomargarita algicola TaxID=3092156 RepID=A0ABZ0RQB7_9BACT|nr:DNRLRE domain-containing protein [Coraliomargarita sp. J2-16]WPJ95119.1 DNRLRE domain-containing protein [Coraliomargarita sp. J2-16]
MKFSSHTHTLTVLVLASAVIPLAATADILEIGTTVDDYIRSGSNADNAQNSTNLILVGDTATAGDELRGMLTFDLSSYTELVGATINSATLTFTINDSDETGAGKSANETITLNLFQTNTSFTESATWNSPWTTAGGDLDNLIASTTGNPGSDAQGTNLDFSGSNLDTAIANTIGGSISFILAIDPSEVDGTRSIFRLTSNEPVIGGGVTADFSPVLSIDYTAVPEPSIFALLTGLAGLSLAVVRRRK